MAILWRVGSSLTAAILATMALQTAAAHSNWYADHKPDGWVDVIGIDSWMGKVACPNHYDSDNFKATIYPRIKELFFSWHIPETQQFTSDQKMQFVEVEDQVLEENHCVVYGVP